MKTNLTMACVLWMAVGCASEPPPVQQMAAAQAASRSAEELGAERNPRAQLHLKYANEQLNAARAAMKDDENERARVLLERANADAELAIALTRASTAEQKADRAAGQLTGQRGATAGQEGVE